MVYTPKEYLKFTLIAALCDKMHIIYEYKEYVQTILQSVKSGINLFNMTSSDRLSLIPESERNSLLNEMVNIRDNYFDRIADNELSLLDKHKIEYSSYESINYPAFFQSIPIPPLFISWKGNFSKAVMSKGVAIIGSRLIDARYAGAVAFQAGQLFAENSIWNHSGLAMGCDSAGHHGSISCFKNALCNNAYTGAILGNGLTSKIYPAENRQLASDILEGGGYLLSELSPSIPVKRSWLILRDRLQSAISDALFVVQTSLNSGTLYTVRDAIELDKPIYVWNGKGLNIPYEFMEGNYQLINKAPMPSKYRFGKLEYQNSNIISIDNPQEILSSLAQYTN